jgi:hypothetical protein
MGLLHRGSKGSASARAQITGYHDGMSMRHGMGGMEEKTALHTTFQMRVVPDDGQAEFASTMSVWGTDADHLRAARWTYVTYDSEHPLECDLDKERVGNEFGKFEGRHRVMVPKDVGDAWYASLAPAAAAAPAPPQPAPPPSEPEGLVAGLSQLADLHAAGTLSDAEFAEAKARVLSHDAG